MQQPHGDRDDAARGNAPAGGSTRFAVEAPQPEVMEAPPADDFIVCSPLVGFFHQSASAKCPPVTVGMAVRDGQVLGAVESMSVLYDVTAEVSGGSRGAGGKRASPWVWSGALPASSGRRTERVAPAEPVDAGGARWQSEAGGVG